VNPTERSRPVAAGRGSQWEVTHRYEELAERLVHLPDQLGAAAVAPLRVALTHLSPWVRRHAVAALARIDDDEARAALVTALHDDSFGVHWSAAQALAAQGRRGVVVVLRAMVHDVSSPSFLHAAAHVLGHAALSAEERTAVAPILSALRHPAADLEAPVLAAEALRRLDPGQAHEPGGHPPLPWYRFRRQRVRGRLVAPPGGVTEAST
jgi:HEAT repeat protein